MSKINETLDLVKAAQSAPLENDIAKAYTQSGSATSGITMYDLEGPAKKLYPIPTLLRNILPRVTGGLGIQANWRSITGINTGNIFGGIGEAQRGAVLSQSTADHLAAFRQLGIENSATFEADLAARGFDDVKALAVQQALESLMVVEEKAILFGNGSNALGTTATPSLAASNSGGTLGTQTLSVIAVALTPQGKLMSSVAGGVVPTSTFTSADGSSIVQDGGAAQKSAAATVSVTGPTGSATATVTAKSGAAGYAWFWGAAGAETLGAITIINSVSITADATGTQLASALAAADKSTNSLVFDGMLSLAAKSGSNAYVKVMGTGVAGVGSTLTADGAGGIVEIDEALKAFYDEYKLSPTHLFVSSEQMIDIKKKIMQGASNSLVRFNVETNQGMLVGGAGLISYLNPFGSATGVSELKIVLHPFMPAGTMMFFSDRLPYPLSNVSSVARMLLRRDYYQLEWPLRTRKYEYGVYMDGVLQHYAPFSMGIITNIARG